MKIKTIAIGIVLIIVLVIVALIAGMGFLVMDVMSYTATGAESLSPAGASAGNALVVYDPGVSGTAKNVAVTIADDLQAKGYKVELAGVKSSAAADVSAYDVIVAGGPTYVGNISSSIKAYLQGIEPSANATVGVYATGSVEPESNDPAYMARFVAGLPDDSTLRIKAAAKVLSSGDTDEQCDAFVAALLQ
jgi:flavodoxin